MRSPVIAFSVLAAGALVSAAPASPDLPNRAFAATSPLVARAAAPAIPAFKAEKDASDGNPVSQLLGTITSTLAGVFSNIGNVLSSKLPDNPIIPGVLPGVVPNTVPLGLIPDPVPDVVLDLTPLADDEGKSAKGKKPKNNAVLPRRSSAEVEALEEATGGPHDQ